MKKVVLTALLLFVACFASANPIDDILRASNIPVNQGLVSDEVFVKRAYLNVVGRIPTYNEYSSFVNDHSPNKRQALVIQLTNTEGYVSHWSNFWMDSLRGKERLGEINYFPGDIYVDYVDSMIRSNVTYDKFVKNLLVSSGRYVDSPGVGYYFRDIGMPADNFIGTVKVFMGLDVGCAQCHNDPFQEWKQRQFYEGMSYFSQIRLRENDKETREKIKALSTAVREKTTMDIGNQVGQFLSASFSDLKWDANKGVNLPKDYKYSNGQPNEKVEEKPLFGNAPESSSDKREEFVNWMYSTNEFSQNIANRMWGYVFGQPITTVSNIALETNPSKKQLLSLLGKRVSDLKFDLKAFCRELYSSIYFQRESYFGDKQHFLMQGPYYSRLTAEQIWDSVVTLSVTNPDYFSPQYGNKTKEILSMDISSLDGDTAYERYKAFQQERSKMFEGARKYNQYSLVRASSILDFSTPSGQLLKKFGRSDRELINSSSRDGNSTQIMAFMNGAMTDIVFNANSDFYKNLKAIPERRNATDYAFISILSRRPNLIERNYFDKFSLDDLVWALLNSVEFKFN